MTVINVQFFFYDRMSIVSKVSLINPINNCYLPVSGQPINATSQCLGTSTGLCFCYGLASTVLYIRLWIDWHTCHIVGMTTMAIIKLCTPGKIKLKACFFSTLKNCPVYERALRHPSTRIMYTDICALLTDKNGTITSTP